MDITNKTRMALECFHDSSTSVFVCPTHSHMRQIDVQMWQTDLFLNTSKLDVFSPMFNLIDTFLLKRTPKGLSSDVQGYLNSHEIFQNM